METSVPIQSETSPQRKRKRRAIHPAIPIIIGVILWAGLLFGGYKVAEHYIQNTQSYIDERIAEVNQHNEEKIGALQGELGKVQEELSAIQEELAMTDETINGTNETKQALESRMAALDKQLASLKNSLKQLEEAIRVQ
ncbi:hypothetical protein [Ammoniphilus resinae]|uniref:Peptidoglycan hydrolase CwlO-like protein n=1 Tax=Ammoniphilus resinae TaxID=861532 RepID=A0ABS4GV07_9BACL|nr:hypothetical protein [Ammoniphilus resinae]MBP1934096.1 peptidoglycan hydrolase CwlO-like protein [Ammoniphilus resinae]